MVVISVVTVIVNFILIPAFGLMGAVYGIVFGYLLALLLSLHLLRRHVRARIRFYFWLKCAFSGSLFLFSILLVKSWLELSSVYLEAFATLLVSGIVYLACVFIFRMTSISEIKGHLKRSFGL
ncbi:hypothetical protein D6825_01780 [Candidatus Woesearchaeota archaeon]|nr:MAG: hypothetical protein D6825_01780 [Candidatus Woesearchaeota archaeon]